VGAGRRVGPGRSSRSDTPVTLGLGNSTGGRGGAVPLRAPLVHLTDLSVLRGDDAARERAELWVLALGQFGLSHPHGALMVGDHHVNKRAVKRLCAAEWVMFMDMPIWFLEIPSVLASVIIPLLICPPIGIGSGLTPSF